MAFVRWGYLLAGIFLLLLSQAVFSADTGDFQKKISLSLEPGQRYSFPLALKNITEITIISASGDASSWFAFGSNLEPAYRITNLVDQSVEVIIIVPNSAEVRDYSAQIKGNDKILSTVEIKVVQPLSKRVLTISDSIADINVKLQQLQSIQDRQTKLDNKVSDVIIRQDRMESAASDSFAGLKKKVLEQESYNKNLKALEQSFNEERGRLEAAVTSLESEKSKLADEKRQLEKVTGSYLLGSSPAGILASFLIGILIGLALVKGVRMPNLALPRIPKAEPAQRESAVSFRPEPVKLVPGKEREGMERLRQFKYDFRPRRW